MQVHTNYIKSAEGKSLRKDDPQCHFKTHLTTQVKQQDNSEHVWLFCLQYACAVFLTIKAGCVDRMAKDLLRFDLKSYAQD